MCGGQARRKQKWIQRLVSRKWGKRDGVYSMEGVNCEAIPREASTDPVGRQGLGSLFSCLWALVNIEPQSPRGGCFLLPRAIPS